MTEKTISAIVRKAERDYISGITYISKYVNFSQYENIEKIDAYLNSRHISGEVDSLGREKPFFNIVTSAVNIWYRATEIQRKDIRIKATSAEEYLWAFLATIKLQEFMKREAFGQFLTEWGRALARYGSTVSKHVVKGGRLHNKVVSWNRIISDVIDFDNNPQIEKLYLTPAQLKQNTAYDQEQVKALLDCVTSRRNINQTQQDIRNEYIELYELHGYLSKAHLTGKETDEQIYVQQMHVVSFVAKEQKSASDEIEYDEFCLLKGKEDKSPYQLSHLMKEEGRSQAIGAVEHLFNAQWMVNHTAKNIKDQLDIASRLIFQTADGSFVGQNVLTNLESGDILIHKPEMPLETMPNESHDITALQNFSNMWAEQAKEITSTPEAITGENLPSGTAYAQARMQNQEAHSLFEVMTDNKGLALEQMMRTFVIPFLKSQLNTSKQISATLEAHDITKLDTMFINAEVIRQKNAHIKKHMLNMNGKGGMIAPPFDESGLRQQLSQQLGQQGNQRFIKPSDIATKTWAELFKDIEWDVEVEVTGDQTDKQAVMESLSGVLQTLATNPAVLQDPNMKLLFNKILETSGAVSPLEIATPPAPTNPPTPAQKQPLVSINYKDLSPDLQSQVAQEAGLKPDPNQPTGATTTPTPKGKGKSLKVGGSKKLQIKK